MGSQRLFVGNLPSDTTENDLTKLFEKFDVSLVEVKRKKVLDHETVFAYVNISRSHLDDCLKKFQNKKWKKSLLKVEVAKESFLDRLKKERNKQNEKQTVIPSEEVIFNSSNIIFNDGVTKNKKIIFNFNDGKSDDNVNGISQHFLNKNEIESSNSVHESTDQSDEEISHKKKLPMFKGTLAFCTNSKETTSDFSMKRFEDFSDVWKDKSPDRSAYKLHGHNKFDKFVIDTPQDKCTIGKEIKKSKHVAEDKRVSALRQKWNNIKEKKETIRKALRNLDLGVKQKNLEPESVEQKYNNNCEDIKKLVLFEDQSDDDFEANFDVKEHLNEKHELEFLRLKSKLANDDRFKLDERFLENDETQNDEHHRQLVGDSSHPNIKVEDILQNRSLIRYDPTKLDHKVLEKNSQKNNTSEKKNKAKKKHDKDRSTEKQLTEKAETPKPQVSKDKHYSVADTLKDAFKKTDEKSEFRLSTLFDEKLKKDNKISDEYTSSNSISSKRIKLIQNPFENISESDDEEDITIDETPMDVPLTVAAEKVLGKCGVWGETFFFKTNDSRLQEATNFYRSSNKTGSTDYSKKRTMLKGIIRKKIQNSRRDNKLFKQKLGGKTRVNKTKFKLRLKKVRS